MTIPIEHNVPMPHIRNGEMRETLSRMKPRDSFKVYTPLDKRRAYAAAYRLGAKITTAKQNGHWRVWLVKK